MSWRKDRYPSYRIDRPIFFPSCKKKIANVIFYYHNIFVSCSLVPRGVTLYLFGRAQPLRCLAEHLNDGPSPPPPMLGRKGSNMKRNRIPLGFWWYLEHFSPAAPPPPNRFGKVTPLLVPYWACHVDNRICSFLSTICVDYSMGILYIVFTIHPVHVHSCSPFLHVHFARPAPVARMNQ